MTREQRLELLKQIEKDIHVCSLESTLLEDAKSCAIHSAIEELEQGPIIDKIRAEIEQNAYPIVHGVNNHELGMTLYGILQVINKYKAESESI